MHVYKVRPRKDHRGFDLISDVLPFGRLWYGEPNAISNAIGYGKLAALPTKVIATATEYACDQIVSFIPATDAPLANSRRVESSHGHPFQLPPLRSESFR